MTDKLEQIQESLTALINQNTRLIAQNSKIIDDNSKVLAEVCNLTAAVIREQKRQDERNQGMDLRMSCIENDVHNLKRVVGL